MKITCPRCHVSILASQLNVGADVAACAKCNEVFSIAALVAGGQVPDDFDLYAPPPGAWFEDTGTGWRIGATTRSPLAFFLFPFMCVWSGGALGGIYGTQFARGEFNPSLSLFGIPFVVGTLVLGSLVLMSICGQVVVSKEGDGGCVFVGVDSIGWTQRFDWASISRVEEDRGYHHNSRVVALIGQSRLKFGSLLSDTKRYYLLQGLRKLLGSRQS